MVVRGVGLGLVVPRCERVRVVEDGGHVDLVDAALEVVRGEVDPLALRGVEAGDIDSVGAVVLEGEFLDADVVDAESCQSSVSVDAVIIRLESPGQGHF